MLFGPIFSALTFFDLDILLPTTLSNKNMQQEIVKIALLCIRTSFQNIIAVWSQIAQVAINWLKRILESTPRTNNDPFIKCKYKYVINLLVRAEQTISVRLLGLGQLPQYYWFKIIVFAHDFFVLV